jgi:predicted hydrocarbon binding protein
MDHCARLSDTADVAQVKGVVILNAKAYVVAHYGDEGWARVTKALAREDREVIDAMISVGWYDVQMYDRINRAIEGELGRGDKSLMIAIGRYAAEHDLTTIHRVFLRVANPAYVLEKSTEFWRRFQDSGTWSIVRESPTRVRATLDGWGSMEELTCIRLAAYIQRLFELVGAKNAKMERMRCRARGDEACLYVGSWE